MKQNGDVNARAAQEAVRDSPLYRRMSAVMHVLIFLYSTAFWVQVGVLPVSTRVYVQHCPIPCPFHGSHSVRPVPHQEAGSQPSHLWLHGDSVCHRHGFRRSTLWPIRGFVWVTSSTSCRLHFLIHDLCYPGHGQQHPHALPVTTVRLHDACHAWYANPPPHPNLIPIPVSMCLSPFQGHRW